MVLDILDYILCSIKCYGIKIHPVLEYEYIYIYILWLLNTIKWQNTFEYSFMILDAIWFLCPHCHLLLLKFHCENLPCCAASLARTNWIAKPSHVDAPLPGASAVTSPNAQFPQHLLLRTSNCSDTYGPCCHERWRWSLGPWSPVSRANTGFHNWGTVYTYWVYKMINAPIIW